jgi:hypothetical protein
MADRKKYYKLDDIGYVGKQEKKSAASQKYHSNKTSKVFREVKRRSKKRVLSNA